MSKIISIGTAVPAWRHEQASILQFMQQVYAFNESDRRKLRYLYHHSGIENRYSVIADYSRSLPEWKFYPHSENLEPFPSLEQRMTWYHKYAGPLSVDAIRQCIDGKIKEEEITHLITVSCTGMSAPGLDLHIMELLDLPKNIYRTSVNFMGCYAAVHALRMADAIAATQPAANVLIVCTELCTLHFQREATTDNIASSLLFADGSAAALIVPDARPAKGLRLASFYSEVIPKGKRDMAWDLSSSGFLMTLSSYIPDLVEEDFAPLIGRALQRAGYSREQVGHWCIHPGGKKILEAVQKSLVLEDGALEAAYEVLKKFGNMSSPTILFVLKKIMQRLFAEPEKTTGPVLAAAFGPGLTMETFIATY